MTKSSMSVNEANIKDVGRTGRQSGSQSKNNQVKYNERKKQDCPLRNLIRNIKLSGGKPSLAGLSSEMNRLSPTDRASALKALQSTRGNKYVQKVVAQAKIDINKPGDIYEQQADSVSDRIMRMPEPANRSRTEVPQMTHVPDSPIVFPYFQPKSNGLGQPLPEEERAFFESRFGHDFSRVQIHANAMAAESAEAIGAKAYTIGQNIAFGAGHYNPGTALGRRLIAHELTHVIQQQGSGNDGSLIQREDQDEENPLKPPTPSPPNMGDTGDDRPDLKAWLNLKWKSGGSLWPSFEGNFSKDDKTLSTDIIPIPGWPNRSAPQLSPTPLYPPQTQPSPSTPLFPSTPYSPGPGNVPQNEGYHECTLSQWDSINHQCCPIDAPHFNFDTLKCEPWINLSLNVPQPQPPNLQPPKPYESEDQQ